MNPNVGVATLRVWVALCCAWILGAISEPSASAERDNEMPRQNGGCNGRKRGRHGCFSNRWTPVELAGTVPNWRRATDELGRRVPGSRATAGSMAAPQHCPRSTRPLIHDLTVVHWYRTPLNKKVSQQ